MFFRRIHCHFCGARSQHSKDSGISCFQCESCQAWNFLDQDGNIDDTPEVAINQPQMQWNNERARRAAAHPSYQAAGQAQGQTFCNQCLHNQNIYLQTLSDYLPEEDHPEYQKYVDALPQFKRNLEERYPQICKKCAPKAQMKINRADYYAGTSNIHRMNEKARKLGSLKGQRDDGFKWSMRKLLALVRFAAYLSLAVQAAWHVYGLRMALGGTTPTTGDFDEACDSNRSLFFCTRTMLSSHCETGCYLMFAAYVRKALLVAACLLWYNSALKDWYHDTWRIQAIKGRREHLQLQLVLLFIRAFAWHNLSELTTMAQFTTQQLIAAHAITLILMVLIQWACERTVEAERFKLNFKMMPKPEQLDVLGAVAGPGKEQYQSQPSSMPPSQLFSRDQVAQFPIENLAPSHTSGRVNFPSPPSSRGSDDDVDAMDIDSPPRNLAFKSLNVRSSTTNPQPMFTNTQSSGWSSMRDELFGIQNDMTSNTSRKRDIAPLSAQQQQARSSPFYGQLPPAPTSMANRMRNPMQQNVSNQTKPSKNKDFMKQMRSGIEEGRMFGGMNSHLAAPQKTQTRHDDDDDDDDDDLLSPAKRRTLDLKPSSWHLKSDEMTETGLENLFEGGFTLADEPAVVAAMIAKHKQEKEAMAMWTWAPVAVAAAAALSIGLPFIKQAIGL
ncbi:hypothetical protein K470DRAFT_254356 [Piedraia hortae CBS 480.64]|uniref:Ima1 N-terminal domain-containing protein n=1 Tax=Piedraia hortae CBS 480.64 TaxID=1314780 RepID=A0A6A7C933_9PEZI|nr:hypothetical protein K470DRAFT_254356 [Piedraia hortae CBS 480.64]